MAMVIFMIFFWIFLSEERNIGVCPAHVRKGRRCFAWFLFLFLFSKKITEEYALLMSGKVDADGLSLK